MHFLGIIIASIFGYLVGSISFSIVIVKWRKGIDIRSIGSGNAGATNTSRTLGKFWGMVVAWLDGLKVVWTVLLAIGLSMIPSPLFSETSYFIPGIFVLIGHCWPIWYKFHGGKAVATFMGLLFISNVLYFIIFLVIWFTIVFLTKRVSVASIVSALLLGGVIIWLPWLHGLNEFTYHWNSISQWEQVWNGENGQWLRFAWVNYLHVPTAIVSGNPVFADSMLEMNLLILFGMMILAYRHFPNIKRIKAHTEPETFPKMTPAQKAEYKKYIKRPKVKNNNNVKEVNKINKIEEVKEVKEKVPL